MAVLVYFKKVRDDVGAVEYHFGPSRDQLDSTVVIDKSNFAALPERSDENFRTAAGPIALRARRAGEWPEVGVIAS
ncbi:hypothetical protein ACFVAV_00255 [Nocardia sp. NPDC057663]|uniref:hypothetical protein n=1 Tax=Nocardia sp. NPDC057663 TaxID=3346201 RepID=UPI00366BFED5